MVKSQLQTLIELTENELDTAAKNLGRNIKARDQANEQLAMLIQYRGDYESKLQLNAKQGLNVAQFANFQAFIGKLDDAIDGQKKLILDAEYRVKIATQQWQELEKKRLSYEVLNKKNIKQEQIREGRRDQKQTDEAANRKLFYKS